MQDKLNDFELLKLVALDHVSAFEEPYERYSKNMFLFVDSELIFYPIQGLTFWYKLDHICGNP